MRSGVDSGRRRWAILLLLSFAELLGMSVWFTASAIAPELQIRWELTASQVGWLTTAVQWGFVAGTAGAAILNLADILPARRFFSAAAFLGGLSNALLLLAPGYGVALLARFFTGFFLAGVYPPAMKMISTWFRSGRGLAIGTVVGALTVGKASPYLLKALPALPLDAVILGASLGAVVASLLVLLWYREGPFPFSRAPFSWGLVTRVLKHRETRLAIGGYLGHMWELYAGWVLAAPFFSAFFASKGLSAPYALGSLMAFGMIAAGGVGSVVAGAWADRWGRVRLAKWAMVISGACSLSLGWLFNAPVWFVVVIGILWGATIVADSAQFSAVVTEVCPSHAVGTALTLQTALGFGLTGVSIQLSSWVVEAVGWGWALSLLAIGPVAGIASMLRLGRLKRA